MLEVWVGRSVVRGEVVRGECVREEGVREGM